MTVLFPLPLELETLIIAVLVSTSCSIVGSFIVAKRMSMLSDGISHAILLGIVLTFFVVKNLDSPLLLVGAVLSGIVLVLLTEFLQSSKLLNHDTALGLVFPFFFGLGVLLIARFASTVHLDIDAVILGELAFAPFHRFEILGYDIGSKALIYMSLILLLNFAMIMFFFKEFFLISFDGDLGYILGMKPRLLSYVLVLILSITTVGAFEAVGSILVVALLVVPPATAIMLTQSMRKILAVSIAISILISILGFYLALYFDLIISGMISSLLGLLFFLVFLLNPKNGYFSRIIQQKKRKIENHISLLVVHLSQHENTKAQAKECNKSNIAKHLFWNPHHTQKIILVAIQEGLVYLKKNILILSENGKQKAKELTEF